MRTDRTDFLGSLSSSVTVAHHPLLALCATTSVKTELRMTQPAGAIEYTDCISADGQDSHHDYPVTQSAEAVEYTDCISADGQDSHNDYTVTQSAEVVEYTDCIPTSVLTIC